MIQKQSNWLKIINNNFFQIASFAVVIFLSHINIFQNQFVMDDFDYIVNWPLIEDLSNWPKFFIGFTPHPGQEGIYSPFKTLIHSIAYHFFKLEVIGYHVLSLIIHLFGTVFVFKICQRLSGDTIISYLAAIFFILHPVQVEPITYMTASVDMVGIVFLFISFYCYILAYQTKSRQTLKYVLSHIFALMAIFTHELAISIPIIFFWYNFCFSRDQEKLTKSLLKVMPFVVMVLAYVLCKHLVLGGITRGPYLYDSFELTMLVVIKAMAQYAYLCLIPIVLTHNHVISEGIYSFDHADFDEFAVLSQSLLDVQVIVSIAVLSFIAYIAYRHFKTNRLISFCIGWFYLCLLPTANIIPSGVYFAERYLYPGMLGFCLLLSIVFMYFYRHRPTRILKISMSVYLILILGFYTGKTWQRNAQWSNEVVFFESAVWANPHSALMRTDMGIIYTGYGYLDDAIDSFNKALKIKPDNPETYFAKGVAELQLGYYTQAIKSFNQSIELKSDYGESHYNLAGIYRFLNDMDKAFYHLNRSIELYRQQGREEEADQLQSAFQQHFQ